MGVHTFLIYKNFVLWHKNDNKQKSARINEILIIDLNTRHYIDKFVVQFVKIYMLTKSPSGYNLHL